MCFSSKYLVLPYEPFRDHISFHLLCYVFFHNILPCIFKLTPLKDKTWSPCERRKKDLTVVSFCHALFYLQTTITKLLNLLYVFLVFVGFCFVYFNITSMCLATKYLEKDEIPNSTKPASLTCTCTYMGVCTVFFSFSSVCIRNMVFSPKLLRF